MSSPWRKDKSFTKGHDAFHQKDHLLPVRKSMHFQPRLQAALSLSETAFLHALELRLPTPSLFCSRPLRSFPRATSLSSVAGGRAIAKFHSEDAVRQTVRPLARYLSAGC